MNEIKTINELILVIERNQIIHHSDGYELDKNTVLKMTLGKLIDMINNHLLFFQF